MRWLEGEAWLRASSTRSALVCAVCAGAIAVWGVGPARNSGFALIDDHAILSMLGRGHALPFADVPRTILASEAGQPFQGSRYRPAFFASYTLETWAWGSSPRRWHTARLVEFALCCAVFLWLVQRRASLLEGLCLLALLLANHCWSDIWVRLGPAEACGTLGLALYALGLEGILSATSRVPRTASLAFACGGIWAMGAKENFLFLAGGAAFVAWRCGARRLPGAGVALAASAIQIAFALFMVAAVAVGVRRAGHVYGESLSSSGLLALVPRWIAGLGWRVWLGSAAVAAVVGLQWKQLRRQEEGKAAALARSARGIALAMGALLVVDLSQFVFYLGEPAPWWAQHYDFPRVLIWPLLAFAGWRLACNVLDSVGSFAAWVPRLRVALALGVAAFALLRGIPLRAEAVQFAETSLRVNASIVRAAKRLATAPAAPVVLESDRPADYELLLSMGTFLWYYGVNNPLALEPVDYSHAEPTTINKHITEELNTLSAAGRAGSEARWIPWSALPPGPCFTISFHRPSTLACQVLMEIR